MIVLSLLLKWLASAVFVMVPDRYSCSWEFSTVRRPVLEGCKFLFEMVLVFFRGKSSSRFWLLESIRVCTLGSPRYSCCFDDRVWSAYLHNFGRIAAVLLIILLQSIHNVLDVLEMQLV